MKLTILSLSLALGLAACSPKNNFENPNVETSTVSASQSDSIIGGVEVRPTDIINQSIVAVYDTRNGQLCTGSLLPNNIVITAAHCMSADASEMVVFFDTNLNEKSFYLPVKKYVVSPMWAKRQNQPYNTGDIAVLHFVGQAPSNYRPAKLLTDRTLLRTGGRAILAGYGISDGVNNEGAGVLRATTVTIADHIYTLSEVLLDQTSGHGACHGDSGGPAYIQHKGTLYLWGVTSRGVNDENDDCSKQAAYTNIMFDQKWINSLIPSLLKN